MSRRKIKRRPFGLQRYDMSSELGPDATAMTVEEICEAINAGKIPSIPGRATVARGGIAITTESALAE